jgi:hypothetical protein
MDWSELSLLRLMCTSRSLRFTHSPCSGRTNPCPYVMRGSLYLSSGSTLFFLLRSTFGFMVGTVPFGPRAYVPCSLEIVWYFGFTGFYDSFLQFWCSFPKDAWIQKIVGEYLWMLLAIAISFVLYVPLFLWGPVDLHMNRKEAWRMI